MVGRRAAERALWLRAAFADLHYDIHHAIADSSLVAVNSTMNGRHVAPWAVCTDDGDGDFASGTTATSDSMRVKPRGARRRARRHRIVVTGQAFRG